MAHPATSIGQAVIANAILYGPLLVVGLMIVALAGSIAGRGTARRRWRWTLVVLLVLSVGSCAIVVIGMQGVAY